MRIALLHSFYRSSQPSGENTAVEAQARALVEHGHDVLLISESSDDLDATLGRLIPLGLRVALRKGRDPLPQIRDFDPQVIHVHNLFPNYGYEWLSKCTYPVVATLHNFRPLCANGLLFREGLKCHECPDNTSFSAIRYGCYRGSHVASIPLAVRNRRGLLGDPLIQRADALVALSDSAFGIFARYGAPRERMVVILQGVDPPEFASIRDRAGYLYAGRFSAEKGVVELANAWPDDMDTLTMIGSGPLEGAVDEIAKGKKNLKVIAHVSRTELLARLADYRGVVIPSLCHESAVPFSLSEAYSRGTPVLAAAENAAADFISRYGGGATYGGAGDLRIQLTCWDEERLSKEAKQLYEQHLTSSAWVRNLEQLYTRIIAT